MITVVENGVRFSEGEMEVMIDALEAYDPLGANVVSLMKMDKTWSAKLDAKRTALMKLYRIKYEEYKV